MYVSKLSEKAMTTVLAFLMFIFRCIPRFSSWQIAAVKEIWYMPQRAMPHRVMEQFLTIITTGIWICVLQRKPKGSEEAGQLVDDYIQTWRQICEDKKSQLLMTKR